MSKEKKKTVVEAEAVKIGKREKAISRAASDDETRHILQGVLIDTEKGVAVATDGRILLTTKLETQPPEEMPMDVRAPVDRQAKRTIVPTKVIGAAVKNLKVSKNRERPSLHKGFLFDGVIKTTDLDTTELINFKEIEGTYPDYEKVYPDFEGKKTIEYTLSTHMLSVLLGALKDAKAESLSLTFSVDEDDTHELSNGSLQSISPAKLRMLSDGEEITGVVMPMR